MAISPGMMRNDRHFKECRVMCCEGDLTSEPALQGEVLTGFGYTSPKKKRTELKIIVGILISCIPLYQV